MNRQTGGKESPSGYSHQCVPALLAGQRMIMDNLQAYKDKKVSALIERLGYELIYLPPSLARFELHRKRGLLEAQAAFTQSYGSQSASFGKGIDCALSAISAQDARGFFEHCGYWSVGQVL